MNLFEKMSDEVINLNEMKISDLINGWEMYSKMFDPETGQPATSRDAESSVKSFVKYPLSKDNNQNYTSADIEEVEQQLNKIKEQIPKRFKRPVNKADEAIIALVLARIKKEPAPEDQKIINNTAAAFAEPGKEWSKTHGFGSKEDIIVNGKRVSAAEYFKNH